MILLIRGTLAAAILLFASDAAFGQVMRRNFRSPTPAPGGQKSQTAGRPKPSTAASPATQPNQPMKKASELIKTQPPINVNNAELPGVDPSNSHVIVSISKQRAYLMTGEQIAIDSPISSGKRGHGTPTGSFNVMEKDKDHRSSLYGDYKDSKGRTVRAGISARIDSAPSGTHYVGAPMKWFMRLTGEGVGMHVGILPGYPASHGCIRMPEQAAEMFYQRVKVGTPVRVEP
jgi:lipoprotein-anchoring transpeptidase ErfK/SrfK